MRAGLPIGAFSSGGHVKPSTLFARMASATASWSGKPVAFLTAAAVVLVWGISGPIFQYSDTWQLVVNTGTTIVTFLMVFLIQSTQNHDTQALQVKLSELILATEGADSKVANIEDATDKDIQKEHKKVIRRARKKNDDAKTRSD